MVERSSVQFCNYIIVDEISLTKERAEPKTPTPPIIIKDVSFVFGKWEINKNYQAQLLTLVKQIKLMRGKFTITGFTDNIGSEKDNALLSLNRANAIKKNSCLRALILKELRL